MHLALLFSKLRQILFKIKGDIVKQILSFTSSAWNKNSAKEIEVARCGSVGYRFGHAFTINHFNETISGIAREVNSTVSLKS